MKTTHTPEGDEVNVIEAVAEGVVMHSLDHLLATHINRMVVLRPNLTEQERLAQLVATFQYVGAAYDFKFDFDEDSYQCCTELVFRAINGLGSVDFDLVREKGRWILAADDIVRYWLSKNPDGFEFVLLAEMSRGANDHSAIISAGTAGEARLRELMKVGE